MKKDLLVINQSATSGYYIYAQDCRYRRKFFVTHWGVGEYDHTSLDDILNFLNRNEKITFSLSSLSKDEQHTVKKYVEHYKLPHKYENCC